ncbi:hypothetical protein MRX96_017342 [Rhipicephalus microplus]
MEIQVADQDNSMEDLTTKSGWLTARSCRSPRGTENSIPTNESSQGPSNKPRSQARPLVKAQVLKVGRMQPLQTEDIRHQDCYSPQGGPSYNQCRQFHGPRKTILLQTSILVQTTLLKFPVRNMIRQEIYQQYQVELPRISPETIGLNTYVNIAAALMLYYSKKRTMPLLHSPVMKHSKQLTHVTGFPP